MSHRSGSGFGKSSRLAHVVDLVIQKLEQRTLLSTAVEDCGCEDYGDNFIPRDEVQINELQVPAPSGSGLAAALSRNPDRLASVVYDAMSQIPDSQQDADNYFSITTGSAFAIDEAMLRMALQLAPMEFTAAARDPLQVAIPRPDGSLEHFAVVESPVIAPELAAQFPGIKTYSGVSLDNGATNIRFGVTHQGFHAQVMSPAGSYYISPYYHLSTEAYVSYYKADGTMNSTINFEETFSEEEFRSAQPHDEDHDHDHEDEGGVMEASIGTQLRTFDTAIATTGEYSAFHGGTTPLVLSALTAMVNLMNGPYERDLSVRLQLVANQTSIIYLTAASDPFTSPGSVTTTQNALQANLDSVIGSANYDIGHVVHRGSDNGHAGGIGVIGVNGSKGRGYSSGSTPTITTWVIDYVSHEMGHQFGGRHTFNSCGGSQGDSSALAVEPGSGTTIMSYAGICGSTNIQAHSDAMFHAINIEQILPFTTGGSGNAAATITNTGNNIPTVNGGPNYTIPANTPFELTAIGSDADAADVLTYAWNNATAARR